jgi:hypothetical protein
MRFAAGKAHRISISSSFDHFAGFGTLQMQVAGLHWAVPSVALDKACSIAAAFCR